MRLQHVHISDYKNLKDFTLSFGNDSFLDVFVGRNGTGKSNLFEALIEIFRHLNEFGRDAEIDFDYGITYEIEGKTTSVEWAKGQLKINNRKRKTVGRTPTPDNVLVYYSGHNDTISNLIRSYESAFQSRIKGANLSDSRYFLGIGPEYKQLLLVACLLKPDDSPCRRFICDKLGIKETGTNLKLTLNRPFYAKGKREYDVENSEAEDRFWKAEGITREFLDTLLACPAPDPEDSRIRTEGYQAGEDKYIIYVDVAALVDKFKDKSPHELFERLDGLKVIEMLDDIEIPLTLDNGEDAKTSFFSDGQFQSVYIFAITELFKERHCLTLLDEPDSFLHPEWQHQFLSQIFEISAAATQTNHTLLSSHSAVTLISHKEEKVRFFEIQNGKPYCFSLPKRVAIKKLSSDLIKYSEQEQLLSIINAIQIENKPVLFTEGSTDPIILKEAWYKLNEEEMPFIPFYAFSCSFINNLLTDPRIHREMGGLPVFGLFDLDQAYNHWNGLNGEVISADPFKGMIKKWANGESYAFVIPVPNNQEIKNQAIKNEATGETFEGQSACEIEHLFYGHPSTAPYFKKEPCAGGEKIVFVSDGQKTKFAKEVIHLLEAEHFEVFRPMLEFIMSKCQASVSAQMTTTQWA